MPNSVSSAMNTVHLFGEPATRWPIISQSKDFMLTAGEWAASALFNAAEIAEPLQLLFDEPTDLK